jgi:hypothetical protein
MRTLEGRGLTRVCSSRLTSCGRCNGGRACFPQHRLSALIVRAVQGTYETDGVDYLVPAKVYHAAERAKWEAETGPPDIAGDNNGPLEAPESLEFDRGGESRSEEESEEESQSEEEYSSEEEASSEQASAASSNIRSRREDPDADAANRV